MTKLNKKFKKVYYDKRRHITQKTPSDCKLASTAMFFNLDWSTVVDLYSQEVLGVVAGHGDSAIKKAHLDYYEKLFNDVFYDLDSGFSGMNSITSHWLYEVLGVKKTVELPFLIKGIPCIISTTALAYKDSTDPSGYYFGGHALYFDGNFIYDPNWDTSDPNFCGRAYSENLMYGLPPFTTFLYLVDEMSNPEKFLALVSSLKKTFDLTEPDRVLHNFFVIDTLDNYSARLQSAKFFQNEPNILAVAKKQVIDYDEIDWDDIFIMQDTLPKDISEIKEIIASEYSSIKDINKSLQESDAMVERDGKLMRIEYPDKDTHWYFNNTCYYNAYTDSDEVFKNYLTIDEVKEKLAGTKIKPKDISDDIFLRKSNLKKKSNPLSQYQLQRFAYAVHAVLSEWYRSLPDDKSPETYSLYSSKSSFSHYFTIKGKVFRLSDHSSGEIRIDGGRKRIRSHDLTHVNSFVKQLEAVLRNPRDIPYLNRIKELHENLIKSASSGKAISKKKSLDRMAYKKIELSRLINDIMTGKVDDILSELLDIDGQWRKDRFIRFYYLVGKNYEISKVDAQELYKNLTENKNFSDYAYSVTNKRYKNNPGKIKTHTRAKKKTYKRARKK
jgi:hypothetical protein